VRLNPLSADEQTFFDGALRQYNQRYGSQSKSEFDTDIDSDPDTDLEKTEGIIQ